MSRSDAVVVSVVAVVVSEKCVALKEALRGEGLDVGVAPRRVKAVRAPRTPNLEAVAFGEPLCLAGGMLPAGFGFRGVVFPRP